MTGEGSGPRDGDLEAKVSLLQQRLDNKSRRIARAIQFNIVAATIAVGIGQFAGSEETSIQLTTTILAGGVALLVSFTLAFAGLAAVGHPLAVGRSESLDETETELRARNRFVAGLQSLSLGTGGFGTALVLFGVIRSFDATANPLPLELALAASLGIVVVGHLIGHLYPVVRRS